MKIDALFINGRFTTLDETIPRARSLGVVGGRIVGLDDDLEGVGADVVYDLEGAEVVPGFNDAHHHLIARGLNLTGLNLGVDAAPTLDALYDAVKEYAAALPEGEWILGHGFDQNKIGAFPDRDVLDRICGGRPAWLSHTSLHMGVANSAALAAAGHPDPDQLTDVSGGHIRRDQDGRVTGLLQEAAQSIIGNVLNPKSSFAILNALEAGAARAARDGLTSITDPGIGSVGGAGGSAADVHWYQTAREEGSLPLRATVMPWFQATHELTGAEAGRRGYGLDLGLRTGLGDEWIRIGPVKIMTDGSLIGRSAAMTCSYHDHDGTGLFIQDELTYFDLVTDLHRNGWQIAAHAIGDAAIDLALDAFDRAQTSFPRADVRHRIEHAGVTDDAQVARIARAGIIPVPQGTFISETGDGILAALGPERGRLAYRMRSFVDAGIELPGSTDAPVVDGAPLRSIHDMVNRRTATGAPFAPDEALTPAQALRAYTVGSAYAVREESRKGTLTRGKLADFTVLSEDILRIDPARISSIDVVGTVVGGQFTHDAGHLAE